MSRLQSALREVFELVGAGDANQPGARLTPLATPLGSSIVWSNSMSFLPHPRVGKGDFSSSAALAFAAHRKCSASELAKRFVELLATRVPGEWYEDNGFIVVKGGEDEFWSDELRTLSEVRTLLSLTPNASSKVHDPCQVFVVPPAGELPRYAAIRLVALGALQVFTSVQQGIPCAASFAGEPVVVFRDASAVALAFGVAVRRLLDDSLPRHTYVSAAAQVVADALQKESASSEQGLRLCVWIAHHTSSLLEAGAKSALATLRKRPGGVVRMPNDGWLISRERAIPEILQDPYLRETYLSIKAADGWTRALFHSASSTPSALFDPAVAHFDELTSPWYAILELHRRFQTLVPSPYLLPAEQVRALDTQLEYENCKEQALLVWMAGLRLPYRGVATVAAGEVLEGVLATEEFCRLAHEYLNRPIVRLNLHQGRTSGGERKILAGINLALSSILPQFVGEFFGGEHEVRR